MNRYQIATLIIGGILFMVVVFSIPLVQYGRYGTILKANQAVGLANRIDINSIIIRGTIVLIGVGLIWYAFGFIKKR